MVTANGHSLNGHVNHGVNGQAKVAYLPCPSDYEAIDVTPRPTPKPGWRDQHAAFTHHVQWIDGDGISHGLTLRSDSLQDLLGDLKLIKGMIKQAKQQHTVSHPETSETQPEHVVCKIHNVEMERRVSKRTGGHYHSHRLPGNDLCFGKAKS